MAPPDVDRIREAFSYNADTGKFVWRMPRSRGIKTGDEAGCLCPKLGYRNLRIDRRGYLAHRVAWLFVNGEWPPGEIDHINGDRADNRISNLRLASDAENRRNSKRPVSNTSGVKGVSWCKKKKMWHAGIKYNYRTINLGYFDDVNEAGRAYQSAAMKYHGEFARFE